MVVDLGVASNPIPDLAARVANEIATQQTDDGKLSAQSSCSILLTSGFYIQADAAGIDDLIARKNDLVEGKRLALAVTLGAEWCCGIPAVQNAAKKADILFGNEAEFLKLCSAVGASNEDMEKNSSNMSAWQTARNALAKLALWKGQGILVMTRGAQEVLALRAHADVREEDVRSVPVPPLRRSDIVDDVGAGDAFMGGFLASLWVSAQDDHQSAASGTACPLGHVSDTIIEACIHAGNSTAAFALTGVGCQFPRTSDAPSPRKSYKVEKHMD